MLQFMSSGLAVTVLCSNSRVILSCKISAVVRRDHAA